MPVPPLAKGRPGGVRTLFYFNLFYLPWPLLAKEGHWLS